MTRLADAPDADLALADLVEALTGRLEAGDDLDPAVVAAQFPAHAAELRRLLPALEALAASGGNPKFEAPNPKQSRTPNAECPGLGLAVRDSDFGFGASDLPRSGRGRLGDFRIVREIGRGGMGVVYEAEQLSLSRRVALKVLPFAAALNPRQLQRFKTEATAAAQLHHSHIVPVYAVGCENGVHYYAMQLIDGQTLADAIAQMRAQAGRPAPLSPLGRGVGGEGSGRSEGSYPSPPAPLPRGERGEKHGASPDSTVLQVRPADDEPSIPAVPAASTAVNSLAAGTTVGPRRGPADFRTVAGLGAQAADALDYAHQLGVVHRDVKPANLMVDARGHLWVADFGLVRYADEGGLTVSGELLGTLRYMSPEQATARRGVVDHRTDVYALGATLYELLTLAPVHAGRTRAELFAQIVGDDPVPPRRHNPAIPVELETVVLKALAKDPTSRYQTAQELAEDLRRFLADQPVHARRPGPGERLLRWARRHRKIVAGVAVMAAFAVGCLAVSLAGIARERDEADRRRDQARRAVDEMYAEVAERWLSGQPHLEPLQGDFLRKALAFYEEFARDGRADPAARLETGRAALRVADIRGRLGEYDRAEAAYSDALDWFGRLASESAVAAAARAESAVALDHRGVLRRARGRVADALADFRAAAAAFARLADEAPTAPAHRDGLAGSRVNLGLALHGLGRLADAEGEYAVALALREKLIADDPASPNLRHDLAACANNFGLLLEDLGRLTDAEAAFTRAVAAWRELAEQYPGVPAYRAGYAFALHNRAHLRANAGRAADADRDYALAADHRRRLRRDFPLVVAYRRDLAATEHGRGTALAAAGRHAEAEAALKGAFDLRQELAAASPEDPTYRGDLAATHHALGDLLAAAGRWAAAGERYRAALALREKLIAGDGCPTRAFELAVTRQALGRVRAACGDPAGAEGLYRAAVAAFAEHADAGPSWGLALAAAEFDLARLLAVGRGEEAELIARRAAERAEAVARQLATSPAPRELAAGAWALVGELSGSRPDDAAAAFRKALVARRWLADRPGARPRDRADLAWFLSTCPDGRFRDPAAAVAAARAAADQAPRDARVWTRLGAALYRAGDARAAADALERAEALRPGGDRTAWLFLALAHHDLGDDEAAWRWGGRAAAVAAAADAEWARLRAEAVWLDE